MYDGELKQIAAKLKAYTSTTKADLLFAITTPMLNRCDFPLIFDDYPALLLLFD